MAFDREDLNRLKYSFITVTMSVTLCAMVLLLYLSDVKKTVLKRLDAIEAKLEQPR